MSKNNRTDEHRPSTIIPANYEQWNTYSLASAERGFPIPAMGVDCATPYDIRDEDGKVIRTVHPVCPDTGRCCVASTHRHAEREGRKVYGYTGRCGVCGAYFKHGSMFRHENGEIVHMGYDCADKYSMMYDASEAELARDRLVAATAKQITREAKSTERREFLDAHPGLEAAFELAKGEAPTDERNARAHAILADMRERFVRFCSLSDKQIAFALKLATQMTTPVAERPVEIKCDAPTGKGIEFTGEIVSVKVHTNDYGSSYKATIKVTRDDGAVWLAWGSLPSDMLDMCEHISYGTGRDSAIRDYFRGVRVDVKATLEGSTSRACRCTDGGYSNPEPTCKDCKGTGTKQADKSFAFMKRPSMTIAGLYAHPKYKAPKKTKCACGNEHMRSFMKGMEWFVCLPGRCSVKREDLDFYGMPIEGKERPF